MPVIRPPSKVLVSGANGFVATWVIRNLLEHGYSVRGTVRSVHKGDHLKTYFASYGDKLEIVIVEDMTKEGAFDEAVKGVDAIAHTASPVSFNHSDELMGPAIQGTIGILQSAKFSPSIKRVVFTSSGATIVRDSDTPIALTEEDWNLQCLEAFKELGESAPDRTKYRASKTLAEQAAWKFMQAHKNEMGWDLSVLNPTVVFGPVIHEVTNPSSLSLTPGLFYRYVADPEKSEEAGTAFLTKTSASEWVDVRDLADAHRLSLEIEEAGNERLIINAGSFTWQDFIDVANVLDPLPNLSKPLPKGNPGAGSQDPATVHLFTLDNTKSKRVLGLKYRSMEEMVRDIFADYEARGW